MMPLYGKRIVVTRASHQAGDLVRLLEDAGASAVLYPCIAIGAPEDCQPLDEALRQLSTFDWLIVTSQNTVHALKDRLRILNLAPDWSKFKIAAVGISTADCVRELWGVAVNLIPQEQTADALADALKNNARGQILLPQSARAGSHLAERLRGMGFTVTAVEAYDNVVGEGGADVPSLIEQIDALTFTSASTVEGFAERMRPRPVPVNLPAVCIGPSTAEAAQRYEYQQIIVPPVYSLRGMVDALVGWFDEE